VVAVAEHQTEAEKFVVLKHIENEVDEVAVNIIEV
jgi:hypothetical protein